MRILYATDGSEGALCAGRFLRKLAHRRDVHVHIVTVLPNDAPEEDGRAALNAAREALGDFPGHVTTAVAHGDSTSEVVEALLFTAQYIDANLLALGASGQSAIARFFLGSVSEAVARHAECPVLLARNHPDTALREVIFGLDGSDLAKSAACWASSTFPLPADCALRLVRVVSPPAWMAPEWGFAGQSDVGLMEQAVAEEVAVARDYLEPLAHDFKGDLPRTVTTQVSVGQPAAALIDAARERNANLLVIGSHGLAGIERFLLGSVSEKAARHGPCSVLIYRKPKNERKDGG